MLPFWKTLLHYLLYISTEHWPFNLWSVKLQVCSDAKFSNRQSTSVKLLTDRSRRLNLTKVYFVGVVMLFCTAAAEREVTALCGWVAHWDSVCESPAGPSGVQGSVCRASGPQDMLHWAPLLSRPRPKKISNEGWIQPNASNRLPPSQRNSLHFWMK